MLQPFLKARVPELKWVLNASEPQWEEIYKEIPELRDVNEWLATQLFTILKADDCVENTNFLAELREDDPEALGDGRKFVSYILGERKREVPGDDLTRERKFNNLCATSFKEGST